MKLKALSDLKAIIKSIEKVEIPEDLLRVHFHNAEKFLEFINSAKGKRIVVDDFQVLQPWAILLLATIGISDKDEIVFIENNNTTKAAKFAHSLGLDEIIGNSRIEGKLQVGRTVRITRIYDYGDIEPLSDSISKLIIASYENEGKDIYFEAEEVRKTIKYVLVELLRNVIQHSKDPNGAMVIAQRVKDFNDTENCFIQIAVVDRGMGIWESLSATRKNIPNAAVALERSLWPGFSGKFSEYESGSSQNAGMGLFYVSEMAKLASGEFFMASRGASIYIKGDPEGLGNNEISQSFTGFDGTLVVFDMPKRGVGDYDELIRTINNRARKRQKRREDNHWIRFDLPPDNALKFGITVAAENTVKAEEFSNEQLLPRIQKGQILCLDFINIPICTQSFLHALLFNAINLAYKLKVPLYATNVLPSVLDGIRMVEMYGLNISEEL